MQLLLERLLRRRPRRLLHRGAAKAAAIASGVAVCACVCIGVSAAATVAFASPPTKFLWGRGSNLRIEAF